MTSLLLSHCSRPLIPIGWTIVKIPCQHIWPLTNLTLLEISKTPAASHPNFSLGDDTPHVISYWCKKRRIDISFRHKFRIYSEEFLFFKPLKNLLKRRITSPLKLGKAHSRSLKDTVQPKRGGFGGVPFEPFRLSTPSQMFFLTLKGLIF